MCDPAIAAGECIILKDIREAAAEGSIPLVAVTLTWFLWV